MTASIALLKKPIPREALLFFALLLAGLIFLPVAIYIVGQLIFGDYGGVGLSGFFGRIYRGILDGEGVTWFLILSPYLGWQVLRLTIWLFRRYGDPTARPSR